MDELDIRLWGRSLSGEQPSRSYDRLASMELPEGKLCFDEEQRLALLGALLEHVGTAYAVRLGPIKAWVEAVEQRLEDLAWDGMPAVGSEQFWRPATQRLSLRRQLELRADVKQLYKNSRQRRQSRRR